MGAVVSCIVGIFQAIGSCLMGIVNTIGAILKAILNGVISLVDILISCVTCGFCARGGTGTRRSRRSRV